VNLPLIGDVAADGLTAEEFEARLEQLLESRYVNRASVSIVVREFRSRPIVVMGAVKSPGNLAFPGRWTLFEALAAAGGLGDNHGEYVYVLRRATNGLTDQVSVRVEDLMFKGDPRVNLPIYANDVINVPVPVEITIFCLGQVMSPGAQKFKSTDRVTVLTVVSRAGGLSPRASKKISVKKRRGDSLQQEVEVDYKKILAGKEPDIAIEDGDVLVVKESFL
jgi:polysaccharide export outer membrane protein